MAHVITFRTAKFDVGQEPPNPINPIRGESALVWLRQRLEENSFTCTQPGAEDWGWYLDVESNGQTYLLGAVAHADKAEPGEVIEWTLQLHKSRSLKDKLLGGNKHASDDRLTSAVLAVLKSEQAIRYLEAEYSA